MSIERRQFIKIAGTGVAGLALATLLPDLALNGRISLLERERLRYLPPERVPLPDHSIIVGTSPDPKTPNYLEQFQNNLEITPGIVHRFIELGKDEVEPVVMKMQNDLCSGFLPMISFGPHIKKLKAQKEMDKLVDYMGYLDGPVLVRPWFEANANWSRAWYGMRVDEYRSMWATLYNQCSTKMIEPYLVYAPNGSAMESVGSVLNFIPDPNHFHFLGLDLYNKKSIYRTNPRYYTYDYYTPEMEIGKDIYDFLHDTRTWDKPLIITEINASIEVYRGGWIAEAYKYAVLHGACAIVSFDHNKKGVAWDESDWRLTNDLDVIYHLSEEFRNRYYYRGHINANYTIELMKAQKLNQVLLPQAV